MQHRHIADQDNEMEIMKAAIARAAEEIKSLRTQLATKPRVRIRRRRA